MNNPNYYAPALLIDGEWIDAGPRESLAVINPANGAEIGRVPCATISDLDRALSTSQRAFRVWSEMSSYDRGRILQRACDLIRERKEAIATQMVLEQGKVLREAVAEVEVTADVFEWFASEGRRAYGRMIPPRVRGARHMVMHEPVGPVAAFAPWNFPALAAARKIAGSLAAGCSCIVKPAEETPGTALAIARALQDAGLPAGVLNVVFGDPATISEKLILSDVIRKVSFTGSTAVGRRIAHLAAEGVKKASLELGGHAPVIVFKDADLQAAALAAAAKTRNAGQVCVSPTRYIVADEIFDRFTQAFAEYLRAVKLGYGLDAETGMGPLANSRRVAAIEELVGDAEARGGRILAGGKRGDSNGFFFTPTLVADLPTTARVMNEEPFGPIATATRFSTFDEAIAEANRLPYGLAAYAFTQSARTATDVADALKSGVVGINSYTISLAETPFGGVGDSGYGIEGGMEGLAAYLATKFVAQH